MATGYVEPINPAFERGGAGSFVLAALPQNERGLVHGGNNPFDGDFSFVNPDPISQSYGGFRDFAFLDDYYFRVYLLPQVLDFGAITGAITRDIQVWNAYFTPVTLLSLTPEFGEEVVVGDEPIIPNSIPALTIRSWSFTTTPEGPPNLDESYTWVFDTGESFIMPVTGTRSVLWPFLPNFSSPFNVTLEYDTSIFTSRNGSEQRIAERAEPRVAVEFDVMLSGAKLRRYRELMALWQDRPFIVADISRNTVSDEPMLAGDTTVLVDNIESWIEQEDRAVVLVSGTGERQQIGLRVIDNADSSNNIVTFKDTDGFDWPTNTKIYAGVVANLEDDKSMSRSTTRVMAGTVRFNVLPGTELVEAPPLAPNEFNDRELFLFKPNWGAGNDNTDIHVTDYVDYGVGRIARFSPVAFPSITWAQNFVGRDAAGIRELLDVFKRMKGRQGEFYMPTWEEDIVPKFDLLAGSLGLRVEGLDVFNAFAEDETTRALMVELNDGTRIFKVIAEITDIDDTDGHDTLINMSEVWDDEILVADIALVCWVRVWRFATDDLTAEFLTNSVANVQMSMITLPDEPAESDESSNSP